MNTTDPIQNVRKEKSEKNKNRALALMLKKELTFGKSKIGITRADPKTYKKERKAAAKSRKINQKRANKSHKFSGKNHRSK